MNKTANNIRNPPREKESSELSLMTYLPYERVKEVLQAKYADGVLTFAMAIYHDKDEAVPHTHVYVRLPRTRKPSQIVNWFRGTDEQGNLVNTFAELLKSSYSDLRKYFTHEGQENKHQYRKQDIWEVGDIGNMAECADVTYEIFEKLIAGIDLRELVKDYGKDFVYHYAHFRALWMDYRQFFQGELNGNQNRTQ